MLLRTPDALSAFQGGSGNVEFFASIIKLGVWSGG